MRPIRYILLMTMVAMTIAGCETAPTRPFIPNKDLPNHGFQSKPDDDTPGGGTSHWEVSQTGITVCRLNPSDKEATGHFNTSGREIGIKVESITDVATVTMHEYCPVEIHCLKEQHDGLILDNENTFLGTFNVLVCRPNKGKVVTIRLPQKINPPYINFTLKFKMRQPIDGVVTTPVQLIALQSGSW